MFDMDGLLFDTEALYRDAIMVAAGELGREMPLALFHRMLGNPWPTNRALLLAHWGEEDAVDALRAGWMQAYDVLVRNGGPPLKPGVRELLDTLDALGLPRAIATSGTHEEIAHNLGANGLVGRFDTAVARGDYARGKPAPDPYLLAAARLGVHPADCLALEDSHNGVRSAAAAGTMAVMVPDLLEPTDEMRALCAAVATDLGEVRRALLRTESMG